MDQQDTTLEKEPRTIDDLPEEVLLMIFKLLDQQSWHQASLTCEMWRSLAVDKISWKIKATSLSELSYFSRLWPDMKTLTMTDFPGYMSDEEQPLMTSEFSKLENLELLSYSSDTLEILKKAQLKTLLIVGPPVTSGRQNMLSRMANNVEVLSFLGRQKNLTTLQLILADYVFKTPIAAENVPFKLKKLSLCSFELGNNGCNNLLEFMKLHEDTLEELQLGHCFLAPIYEFVFAKLKKLNRLGLMIDGLPRENFLKHFEVNQSVTTLTLVDHWRQCTSYEVTQIIRHLPNIENLVLFLYQPYNKLSAALPDLKQLKHLTVRTFDSQFWQNVTFPKLESLRFVNAELEHKRDIAFVAKNLNLRSLVFDGHVDNDFLDAISANFPKLVSLDLQKSNFDANATTNIRGLRLREEDFFKPYQIHEEFFQRSLHVLDKSDNF